MNSLFALFASLGICLLAAGLGSYLTRPSLPDWYDRLRKPSWTPRDSVFPPVWTTLFGMMAVATWLVWKQEEVPRDEVQVALGFFLVQLVLNVGWSWIFFRLKNLGWALAEIVLLWVAILLTVISFWGISTIAGALLLPYLAWVGFAALINFMIWRLNPGSGLSPPHI